MTEEIIYDQDKLMIVSENGGNIIYTEEFHAYRQQRGLRIYLCRGADPESMGKVENVVKFIKGNYQVHNTIKKETCRSVCLGKATLAKSLLPAFFRKQLDRLH